MRYYSVSCTLPRVQLVESMLMLPAGLTRWTGLGAAIGGILWTVYGAFLMLEPWGVAEVYKEDLGYQLVTNRPLYWIYTLPGGLALMLTALALLGIRREYGLPRGRVGKLGLVLTYLTLGLALLSLVGGVTLIAPLSFAGRAFGTLALGAATFLIGLDLPSAKKASKTALLVLGGMGLLLLPLLPLVFAVALITTSMAAVFFAVFGLGWSVMGYHLWAETHSRQRTTL